MNDKTKSINLKRKSNGKFICNSPTYDNTDLAECELLVLLGALFGVTITDPKFSNCYWRIDITRINPE